MKKQGILTLVAFAALLGMVSCNKYEAKSAKLENQNDSLNYALGLANGEGIKNYYMASDSSETKIVALLGSLDKSFKRGETDEMYKLGLQIGNSLKVQKVKGLFNDSTMKFDEKLVKQGMVNGVKKFGEGMTVKQAQEYIQTTMMKIQQAKMAQQAVIQQLPNEGQASQQVDSSSAAK